MIKSLKEFNCKNTVTKTTIIIFVFVSFLSIAHSQSHTFPVFSPGMFTSDTPGITTTMPTSGLTDEYIFFQIKADYIGTSDPLTTSWSSTMEIEITDGTTTTYVDVLRATFGGTDDGSQTILYWIGLLGKEYIGGDNLSIRFYDDYDDADGPYVSNITNVEFTISNSGGGNVSITGSGATTVTGTHPTFTVSSTDTDTQLSEAQVDAFTSNNGYALSSSLLWSSNASGANYNGGNVGIGTANPIALLHLENGDTPGIRLAQNSSGGFPAFAWGLSGNESNFFLSDMFGNVPFLVSASGNVGIGTSTPAFDLQVSGNVDVTGELTAVSDRRLKKDIRSIQSAMDLVNDLNPVSYYYRVDEFPELKLAERRKMGLIAQEVKAVLPNLVSGSGKVTSSDMHESETLSVNYMEMIPLLIKALQEQDAALEKKDAQSNSLLLAIKDMQKEIDELKEIVETLK